MTEIKLTLDDPAHYVRQLRHAGELWSDLRLTALADSIEEQVKPVVEEPTGDVVVFVLGRPWWPREGGVHWVTYEHSNNPPTWGELVDEVVPDAIQIYRREEYNPLLQQVRDLLFRSPSGTLTHEEAASAYKALYKGLGSLLPDSPQSDGTGALPTSPSPEVGVATSPPLPSPQTDDGAAAPPAELTGAATPAAAERATTTAAPSSVNAEYSDLEYATRLDGSTMPAPMVVPNEHCWCGGEVGGRIPGDHLGLGCLADVTHNWTAASRQSQDLIEAECSLEGCSDTRPHYHRGDDEMVLTPARIGVGADNTAAYRLAREDAAREIRARIQALRDAAITAVEKEQLDKAMRECR